MLRSEKSSNFEFVGQIRITYMSIHGAIFQLVSIDGKQHSVKELHRNTACIIQIKT